MERAVGAEREREQRGWNARTSIICFSFLNLIQDS